MNRAQVLARLRKRRLAGESVADFAKRIGEFYSPLWNFLEGNMPPSPKILKFLGLRKVKTITYESVK